MLKKLRVIFSFTALFLLFLWGNAFAVVTQTRIAILPFKNISAEQKYDWLSYGFSESLTSAFAQTGKFIVVERGQLDRIMKEQAFQASGFADESNTVILGKILGVDKLIIGSYQIYSDDISINSRVVDVKTATVEKNGAITNKRDKLSNIFALQEEICLIQAAAVGENLQGPEKAKVAEATSKSTSSLSAYEYYLNGRTQFLLLNPTGFKNAVEQYNKALQIDSGYALAISDLAQVYSKWGNQRQRNGQEYLSYYQKAIEYGTKAVRLAPGLAESHRGLGLAYFKIGRFKESEAELKKALAINPQNSETLYFLWKIMDEPVTSEYILKAIELNPHFSAAYNDLGVAYLKQKNYDKARENFNKAIESNSKFAYVYTNLGDLYLELKDYDQAVFFYKKALEIDPEFSHAYINLGNAYNSLNQPELAIDSFKMAIAINKDFVLAYNNLGGVYHSRKNYLQAINNYKKAIEINPAFTSAYFNLGLAYENQGQKKEALEVYQQYMNKFPDAPEVSEFKKIVEGLN